MQTQDIVAGWLSGADNMNGYDNPAGPLYAEGTDATEAAMTDPEMMPLTNCSACSASRPGYCC